MSSPPTTTSSLTRPTWDSASRSERRATARFVDGKFNEAHIIAITAAIIEYRASQGINGPLFIGRDTHALSEPAWRTALEVLAAAGIDTRIDSRGSYTPTPAVSVAILGANGAPANLRTEGDGLADGIVVTPSHNPPRDGGFKYNPPHGGPADTDATGWIAARANELLDSGEWKNVPRVTGSDLLHDPNIKPFDYLEFYVSQLDQVVDIEAIRKAGVRIGADPLGGASIDYWAAIGEHYGLDLTVVNPEVDPAWPFMTLDWDGKIRMDCSSPYAMASLRQAMTPDAEGNTPYDIATGNDADSDRHGIVTPDGLTEPEPLPGRRHRVPVHAPSRLGCGRGRGQDPRVLRAHRPRRGLHGPRPHRGARGLQVLRARPAVRHRRFRRRGERGSLVPAQGRHRVVDR